MKTKLIGIFVCMLVIVNMIPVAISLNLMDDTEKKFHGKYVSYFDGNGTELPVWKIGDSWTYDLDFSFDTKEEDIDISADLSLNNLNFVVEDDTSNSYQIELTSDVEGNFFIDMEDFPRMTGTLKQTDMNGHFILEKTNLGINEIYIHVDGKVRISLIAINLDIDLTINFNPTYTPLSFPLNVGNEWTINESLVSINCVINLPGITKLFPSIPDQIPIQSDDISLGGDALCAGGENITLDIGMYNAYNITISDSVSFYYAPVVGNILMLAPSIINNDFFDLLFTFELTSTTYTVPGAPNKPSKPSGSNRGEPDTAYTYSTSTNDAEGDDIYYFFDWGDGSYSGWMGAYKSEELMNATHNWTESGSYIVRVKAKDTENHESSWSDPLTVSMSKNKIYNLLPIWFEKLLTRFPLLQQLLDI